MKRLVIVLALMAGGCRGQQMLHEDVRDDTVMWGWADPFGFNTLRWATNEVRRIDYEQQFRLDVTNVIAGAGIEIQRPAERTVLINAVGGGGEGGLTADDVKGIVGEMGVLTNAPGKVVSPDGAEAYTVQTGVVTKTTTVLKNGLLDTAGPYGVVEILGVPDPATWETALPFATLKSFYDADNYWGIELLRGSQFNLLAVIRNGVFINQEYFPKALPATVSVPNPDDGSPPFVFTLPVLQTETGQYPLLTQAQTDVFLRDVPDGSVVTAKLADGAVTAAKLADKAVTAQKIADSTITATQIANTTITGNKLANATVTGAQLAGNTVSLAHLNYNLRQLLARLGNNALFAVGKSIYKNPAGYGWSMSNNPSLDTSKPFRYFSDITVTEVPTTVLSAYDLIVQYWDQYHSEEVSVLTLDYYGSLLDVVLRTVFYDDSGNPLERLVVAVYPNGAGRNKYDIERPFGFTVIDNWNRQPLETVTVPVYSFGPYEYWTDWRGNSYAYNTNDGQLPDGIVGGNLTLTLMGKVGTLQ